MTGLLGRFSLRTKFAVALAILVISVAGLFGGVVAQHSIAQLRERIGQSLAVDAQRAADRLNTLISEKSRDLLLVSSFDVVRNVHDIPGVQAALETMQRSDPAYLWLAVTDTQGNVLAATDPTLVGSDLAASHEGRDQLRGRPAGASDPLRLGRSNEVPPPTLERQRQITIARPVRNHDGPPTGVLVAQLDWNWVKTVAGSLLSPDGDGQVRREILMVSAYDTVLLGPPGTAGQRLTLPEINRARAGIFGWSSATWPDGKRYIVAMNFVSGEAQSLGPGSAPMRWVVLVREAEDTAFAPAQQLLLSILSLGVGLSLAVAFLGWIIAGIITRPLRQIAASADQLRRGETVELPILRSSIEIESLSASLRALVATLTFKQSKLDELESANQHDLLTRLLNRAGLQTWFSHALAQARTEPSGLLVLVGDLDGFKQVNDTRGHAIGDKLLEEVARRLQSAVRARDAVARMGGDEFVIALHAPLGLADHLAIETAQRLWSRATEPYVIEGETVTIGISLGGAGWPEDGRQIDAVLNKADAALYAAKRNGKGRVVFHRDLRVGSPMAR